jgi:farnesyl-diphosphate farnesyltransferase
MSSMSTLLEKTSRTFALSIPFLPANLQRSVTVAYLIFRIVDTIEDEFEGDIAIRAAALNAISSDASTLSGVVSEEVASLLSAMPEPKDPGYVELLRSTPAVLAEYQNLDEDSQSIISEHLARTARGMAQFLGKDLSGGQVYDLRSYCYIVAGIVGEMCSALFVSHQPELASIKKELQRDSAAFGEGLQLVNIIRDAKNDLHAGRCYLPRCVGREELIALARQDLRTAYDYIQTLESASALPGVVAFNTFNTALANMTLDAIEQDGAGAKVSREQVSGLHKVISQRVSTGLPVADLAASDQILFETRAR